MFGILSGGREESGCTKEVTNDKDKDDVSIEAEVRLCNGDGGGMPVCCCNRARSGGTSTTSADGGRGLQKRSDLEGHSGRRVYGHDGDVCCGYKPELHQLPCVGQHNDVGQI